MMDAILGWVSEVLAIPGVIWLQQIYLGLINGAVFVMMALGLTIIFGLLGIFRAAGILRTPKLCYLTSQAIPVNLRRS